MADAGASAALAWADAAAAEYAATGYAVVRGFLSHAEVARVLGELDDVLREKRAGPFSPPAFRALGDARALEALRSSAARVDVFGAPGVVDTVGHGFHWLPASRSFVAAVVTSERAGAVARRVAGLAEPRVAQTKFVMKPARAGARVPAHADEQYVFTEPASGVALWIALDAADETNGCVEVLPRSHVEFAPGPRFAVGEPGGPAVWWRPPVGDGARAGRGAPLPQSRAEQDSLPWVAVRARPGDLVALHHALLHRSAPNSSHAQRRALTAHLVDAACAFSPRNWIPEPEGGFPGCM